MDFFVAGIALVVLAPCMVIVALLIRLDTPGPAIFRQERVGRGGQTFQILKFRTMNVRQESGALVTSRSDDRITRVGHVLRASKIDELPQLVNVLRGEMALVGPRPEVPRYVQHWSRAEREEILSVRPGITDPAAILYRHEANLLSQSDNPEGYYLEKIAPDKARLYIDYVRHRTFWGDCAILFRTFRAIVGR